MPVLGADKPQLCVEAHSFLAPMLCSGDVPAQCCGEVMEVQQVFMISCCMLCPALTLCSGHVPVEYCSEERMANICV